MVESSIEMHVPVKLLVPRCPNFILFDGVKDRAVDIAEFTDPQLRTLGKMWLENLLAHAATRRSTPREKREVGNAPVT